MTGGVKSSRSPKIGYEEDAPDPVQSGSLCCREQPGALEQQVRSSEATLCCADSPSSVPSTTAAASLEDTNTPSNANHCTGPPLIMGITRHRLPSKKSPLASGEQTEQVCCSESVPGEKQNISDSDCCQKSTLEISANESPKSQNDHHDEARLTPKEDSSKSPLVEARAINAQHNSKSIDLNCPVNAASVLLDSSAGHITPSPASSASSAANNCNTSKAVSSRKTTPGSPMLSTNTLNNGGSKESIANNASIADLSSGVSRDSAPDLGHNDAASATSGDQASRASACPDEAPEQELREACGVFGFVLAKGEEPPPTFSLSRTIMDGLVSLQHRGQESAGIVTSDGRQAFKHHRGLGLVSSVFSQEKLATLTGILGLGHTRYSTAGGSDLSNVQPFMVHTRHGQLAIAHNGELINADTLRKTVMERGVGLSTRSDSELITQILSLTPLRGEHHGGADWRARIRHLMEASPTSYSLAIMNEDKIYAVRDPFGNRPLCVGLLRELDEEGISLAGGESSRVLGYVLSSESCAFTSVGATFMREVMPGEIIELSPDGVRRIDLVFRPQTCRPLSLLEDVSGTKPEDGKALQHINGNSHPASGTNGSMPLLHDIENVPPAFCIFEYVYFARPDSYFEGQQVYSVRQRSGRQLALEAPVDVDIVSCVPESATPAAMGFAMQLNLPYVEVLHKSRYVGRTFIQPCVTSRKRSVVHKFAAIAENVRGKRVVLVDDSVVRGTTIRPIVKLIRDAGAKEVHFRVASPPIRHPCYMGINIPTREELVANRMPLDQLAEYFCVDSLQYLSLEGLVSSVREGAKSMAGETVGHCTACLSGKYPVKKEY